MRQLRIYRDKREAGLTLVVVAFGLIMVTAFAGLAIDGSNAFLQRRRVQNASDAASLAAAAALAQGAQTNGEVLSAIKKYIRGNGGTTPTFQAEYFNSGGKIGSIDSYGESSAPPAEATGVCVSVHINYPVLFGGILGVNRKSSSAEAAAQVGPAGSLVKNVFPLGVNVETLDAFSPGTNFRIWENNQITDTSGIASTGQRGWLNLNFLYSSEDPDGRTQDHNYSNTELKSWVAGECTTPIYAGQVGGLDGDFINGDPGVRASAILEAREREGQVVYVPVYDRYYDQSFVQANLSPAPSIGWIGGSGGSVYYHIVGFAAFTITNVSMGNDKYIEGRFIEKVSEGGFGGFLTHRAVLRSVGLTDVPTTRVTSSTSPSTWEGVSVGGSGATGG